MSDIATEHLEPSEPVAAPQRKLWRAPEVILAQACPQTAKTSIGAPESHAAGSTFISS